MESFDIWDPINGIGEVGAAMVPIMIGLAQYGCWRGFTLERYNILCHAGNDAGKRAAWVLTYQAIG